MNNILILSLVLILSIASCKGQNDKPLELNNIDSLSADTSKVFNITFEGDMFYFLNSDMKYDFDVIKQNND